MFRKKRQGSGLRAWLTAAALSALVAGPACADLAGKVVELQTRKLGNAAYDMLIEEVVDDVRLHFEDGGNFYGEKADSLPPEVSAAFTDHFFSPDTGTIRFYVVRHNRPARGLAVYDPDDSEPVNRALHGSCGLATGVAFRDAGALVTSIFQRHVSASRRMTADYHRLIGYFALLMGPSSRYPGKIDIYHCSDLDARMPQKP